jgi:hypothetical protein
MAGLSREESRPLPVVPCCMAEKQAACCTPAEKAKCCPPGTAGCGCQASRKP